VLENFLLNLGRNLLWRYLLASSIEDISCSFNSLREQINAQVKDVFDYQEGLWHINQRHLDNVG